MKHSKDVLNSVFTWD